MVGIQNLLVSSGRIISNMHWCVYDNIIEVLSKQEFLKIREEIIELGDHVENGEEAVGTSWGILLWVILEREDSTVKE